MSFFLRCIVFFRYFFMYFFIIFVCNFLWIVFWLFFEIVLLCYFNLSSSITSCLSSEDLYLFLAISYSCSFVTVSQFFCCGFCSKPRNFIINFITNQITSCFCCFLNCSFRSSFRCISCRLFSMIKKFLTRGIAGLYLPLTFLLINLSAFLYF